MVERSAQMQVVVCGDTVLADRVARQAAVADHLTIIRTTEDAGTDDLLAARPDILFLDFATDLRCAGVLETVLATRIGGRLPQIVAHIRDRGLRRAMQENIDHMGVHPRPHLFDTASVAAAKFGERERLFEVAYWRGQDRLHACIIGFSAVGCACLHEVIMAGVADDLHRPRITLLDEVPAQVRHTLDLEMPEIGLSADIDVQPVDTAMLTAPESALLAAEDAAPLTAIIIAIDDPVKALACLRAVVTLQSTTGRAIAGIFIVSEHDIPALVVPAGRPHDIGRSNTAICAFDATCDVVDLLTLKADVLPRRMHETLRRDPRFGSRVVPPWDDLPETLRRAHRRAARHLPIKLWTAGLLERGPAADPAAVTAEVFAAVIRPSIDQQAEDALVRRLARLEHERWSADRRIDGWTYGAAHDDALRHDPALVSFDDPRFRRAAIKEKIVRFKVLVESVLSIDPDGATVPFVLGVSSSENAAVSIDPAAALKLCGHDTWRPIIVICALLDDQELARTAALARLFDEAGRRWRLIVPEVRRDNAAVRSVAGDGFAHLMARPSTLIAPIGTGAGAATDAWIESDDADQARVAILDYMRPRVSAMVGCPQPDDGRVAA